MQPLLARRDRRRVRDNRARLRHAVGVMAFTFSTRKPVFWLAICAVVAACDDIDATSLCKDLDAALNSDCTEFQSFLIRDAGARALAEVLPKTRLTTIDLTHSKIGDAGALALAEALPNSQLTTLMLGAKTHQYDLRDSKLGDVAARALAEVLPETQLTVLDLRHNSIGDAGARALAGALPKTQLTTLVLGSNSIGDAGARALADALPETQLTELDLNDNAGERVLKEARTRGTRRSSDL